MDFAKFGLVERNCLQSRIRVVPGFYQSSERLLQRKGVAQIKKIRVDVAPGLWQAMAVWTGRCTVPQIYIGDLHVGGFDDLAALDKAGRLDELLRACRRDGSGVRCARNVNPKLKCPLLTKIEMSP